MIQGVIFDLDGVVVTTDDCHYRAWKRMADEEGFSFDRAVNERLRGVSRMASLDIILERASALIHEVNQGQGVLILTDIFGATPCNIGLSLGALGVHLRCVSGLNLPMLLRVLNYADKPLDELAEVAASGGKGGILIDKA